MRSQFMLLALFMGSLFMKTNAQSTDWGVQFSDAIISRHPNTINDLTGKNWEYSNSIVLYGMIKIHAYTHNPAYVTYIQKFVDTYVSDDGSINFDSSANNLDHLHPGLLCLFLYQQTGEEKYKLAAQNVRAEFDEQPRNSLGGFWHKERYANQMWADGIYMAEPFLMEYGAMFDDLTYASDEATQQVTLLADHAYDSTLHLLYHGWDETLEASWADENGRSPEVWSRGMGWYCMALVDILEDLPQSHSNYNRLVSLVQDLAIGIKENQDETTGLWYQVVNKGDSTGNWIETSGSAMFLYMLQKALTEGYIDSTYEDVVSKGWAGMQNEITLDDEDQPVINHFVQGMGIKDTYESYISQTRVSTPSSKYPHGYCAILSLASAMEWPKEKIYSLHTEVMGWGDIITETEDTVFMPGRYVKLVAREKDGSAFDGWTGDVTSTDSVIYVEMDAAKSVTANFVSFTTTANVKEASNWILYPNPATDELYLTGVTLQENTYCIYSSAGKLVKEGKYSGKISIAELPSGLYCIDINQKVEHFIKK